MSFNTFIKIITTDSELNRLQTNIEDALTPITKKPQLDSEILTNITLTVGIVNNIPHKLNRIPIGFKLINKNAQSDVWNAQKSDSKFLYLTPSATIVCDIEVS